METDYIVSGINYVIHRLPSPEWKMENIVYDKEYILVMALEGKAYYNRGDEKITAQKNDILFFPPGVARSAVADMQNPWEFISVNFSIDFTDETKKYFDKTIIKIAGSELRGKFTEIDRCWTGKNPLYKVKCKNLVSEILYELILEQISDSRLPHMGRLEESKKYIQENFRDKITVEMLAEKAGLSGSYFRKIFKEAFGDAPMNYITKLRISAACDLLMSGEANVTETAEMCGFDDIYYFSTIFKRHIGMSPMQFVKMHSAER